jgi:hypothetical protein
LLFMGQEFAQGGEWAESRSLDWWLLEGPDHRGVARLIRDLNRAYGQTNALWSQDIDPSGFHWIDANDASGNTFSFLRFGTDGSVLACVANFSPVPHYDFRLGLPFTGRWDEIINTDAEAYFGSGVGNFGGVEAVAESWHGQAASATLRVPPLGALWLRYRRPGEEAPVEAVAVEEPVDDELPVEAVAPVSPVERRRAEAAAVEATTVGADVAAVEAATMSADVAAVEAATMGADVAAVEAATMGADAAAVEAATMGADAGVPPADAIASVDATTSEPEADPKSEPEADPKRPARGGRRTGRFSRR